MGEGGLWGSTLLVIHGLPFQGHATKKDTPCSARQLARLVAELLPYAKGKVAAKASSLGDPCKKAGKALRPMDQAVPTIAHCNRHHHQATFCFYY